MKLSLTIVWTILLALTAGSVLVASLRPEHGKLLIGFLFACKFALVLLYFMNTRKAHAFWKLIPILYFILLFGLILVITG